MIPSKISIPVPHYQFTNVNHQIDANKNENSTILYPLILGAREKADKISRGCKFQVTDPNTRLTNLKETFKLGKKLTLKGFWIILI